MVTLRPPTVRAMVHLFQQLGGHRAEAEAYYMAGVDLVVPSVYPEQEGIAAGSEVVRIEARIWMTAEEMAVLARIALLEIGNVGIISRSEQRTYHFGVKFDRGRRCRGLQLPLCKMSACFTFLSVYSKMSRTLYIRYIQ